jgi:hypothetical protein
MNRKNIISIILMLGLGLNSCVKNTYDLKKLSSNNIYSPTFVISAATGNVTFSDMVKASDTVVFDNDKLVRIIFKKDSVINFQLKDYFDLNNMVSFSKGYKMGDLSLDNFQSTIPITLSTISSSLSPALRTLFTTINGTVSNFPAFPQVDLGEKSFSIFNNFQNAVFSSGTLTISVRNNLAGPLGSVRISLFNSAGHTPIGSQLTIPAIAAGATQSATLDLAGKTITNSVLAAIILSGSAGTSSPVLIDLNSSIQIGISATNLKVQSGRIILPTQTITSLSGTDVVSFNPGTGIEIEKLKILTGNIGYTLISTSTIRGSFTFTLPTTPVITRTITINGPTNLTSSISLNNTEIDLGSDVSQPFNRIPVNYSISVNSNGTLINFNRNDSIHIAINMLNPGLDYVKGYFGQQSQQVDPDNLDTGLKDIINNLSGQLRISNPSISLTYSNSFGIPIEVTLDATGKRNSQSVPLGLAPFTIAYPTSLAVRDVSSSFTISNTNSSLSNLISLPPFQITFSGSAKLNPAGATGGRNNYVFGNSRFLGSLEVNVPLQFWLNNIQFSDTLDNFIKPDNSSNNNSSFKPEDMDSLQVNLIAQNGFPLGASLKMLLYDSVKKVVIKTIDAPGIILAAPVNATGKVTGKTESKTTINFNKAFFDAINSANKIILLFTLNTSENGTKDVKIYSDYSIIFKASVLAKPRIKL